MRLNICLAVALVIGLPSDSAFASTCSTEIETVSKQVKEGGRDAIAASTGGKAVAGAREGQGMTGTATPDTDRQPKEKSSEAGKGAENVQAANVALDGARTLDGKGDEKGCMEAIATAKKKLSQTP